MHLLSYQGPNFTEVRAVVVADEDEAQRYIMGLPEGACGLRITGDGAADLTGFSGPTIVILYNALAESPVKKFENLAQARARLVSVVERVATPVTPEMLAAPQTAESDPASADQDQQPVTESTQTEEAAVAAKKKTKVKKEKSENGGRKLTSKPAGKVSEFKQARPGTVRAKVLEAIAGRGATMEEIVKETGLEQKSVVAHLFCTQRDCGIGYEVSPTGIIKALFPGDRTLKDALKAPAEKKEKKSKKKD